MYAHASTRPFFIFYLYTFILSFLSCAQPTDSPDDGVVERERIEVSGPQLGCPILGNL